MVIENNPLYYTFQTVENSTNPDAYAQHSFGFIQYGWWDSKVDIGESLQNKQIKVSACDITKRNPECLLGIPYQGTTIQLPKDKEITSITITPEVYTSGIEKGYNTDNICDKLQLIKSHWYPNYGYGFWGYFPITTFENGSTPNTCKISFDNPQNFPDYNTLFYANIFYGIKINTEGTSLIPKDIGFKVVSGPNIQQDRFLTFGRGYIGSPTFTWVDSLGQYPNDPIYFGANKPLASYNNAIDFTYTVQKQPCMIDCHSSVMFLPGIMGSKLYEENGNNKVWDAGLDSEQAKLATDSNGYSINNLHTSASTTHATEGVIHEILGQNVYKSFMSDLSDLKTSNTIQDYSLIPYDWRLPLAEIVSKGKVVDNKLYYGTTTPSLADSFIIKELRRLADNSKSGKVTIVAHSNGGLVTKELIQTLKETNNPLYEKIDKVIMVAVPQVGTPEAVTTLLHGSAIGNIGVGAYTSSARTRDLFQNMPSMYNLLPTEGYFNNLSPLIEFKSTKMVEQGITYGSTINTYQEYLDYLKGTEGRTTPTYSDTLSPAKANQTLLNQAIATHQRLDNWLPATSTKVYQVAGWGIYTPSGIKYSDKKTCVTAIGSSRCIYYDYKTTISDQLKLNGDGTVLSGSAQAMGESGQTENWWVDLLSYNKGITRDREHKDITEVNGLRNFIKNLVTSSALPIEYLSQSEPSIPADLDGLYTKYQIHSPLHLTVIDSQGNITGYSTSTSQILENIKGSQYLESADVKTIILPQNTPHKVFLTAYDSGSFTLELSTLQGNTESQKTIFEAVPVATSTIATFYSPATSTTPVLSIDFDGDSTIDISMQGNIGTATLYVSSGRAPTVGAQPTPPIPVVSYSSNGYYSTPNPVLIIPILQSINATTTVLATKPIEVVINKNKVSIEKKAIKKSKIVKSTIKSKPKPQAKIKEVTEQSQTPQVASVVQTAPSRQYMSPWQRLKARINSLIK